MRFRSAVGGWYYLVIVFAAVIIGTPLPGLLESGQYTSLAILGCSALFALGLPVWLLFSTHYTITPDLLTVRCGPFSWQIPRAAIHSVGPTRSALSGPALSLDRLEIRYGRGNAVLVSPMDKTAFQRALGFDQ
jgi:hypothetical protein